MNLDGDLMALRKLEVWHRGCQFGMNCETPEEAEKLYSIFKSALELGMSVIFRNPKFDPEEIDAH